ncbi:glycosyltransferase family 4 protein [Aureliella helgolandensis]|uniref:Glycosyltransferase EpsD n=1 Tax=Aureliella helgolandensis TaxID=2527968 RepID=A0A518GBY6_9BACT|nr:glycosyltransferase family 4 protein [Aureliella helgolandensis]QDV26136.1 Putative glycosyltransferase EpsD [Aureliella helgolandensis]
MVRKRLVIVTTVPETLETILRGQPRFLTSHFEVSVVTSDTKAAQRISADENVPVQTVEMERQISIFRDMRSVASMIFTLRKLKPDIVHSYTPKAGLVTMLAAWVTRVPTRIHTFTGLVFPTSTGFKRQLMLWADRVIARCATCVVPEGEGVRNDLIKYGVTSNPAAVIGHGNIAGVDTAYFQPTVEAESTPLPQAIQEAKRNGSFFFGFVGRLNRDKGLAELTGAFSRLPDNCHLLVVGALDGTAPADAETMASLKQNPRVHLVGFQKDIRPFLNAADVVVLPSYREGFPNVLLQAGAMAKPVIATNINGCNEIVEEGKNGWLVEPRDTESLFLAMQAASTTPSLDIQRLGSQARARIQERFERSGYWQALLKFYESRTALQEGAP